MAEKRDREPRNEEQRDLDENIQDIGGEGEKQDDEVDEVESEDEDLDEDVVDEEESNRG